GIALAAAALATTSCVRHTVVTARPPQPLSQTVWERQVRNARDAGDGDYELRSLREKVAARPADIPARLDLARAYQDRGYPEVALEICRLAADRFPESGDVELALVRALRSMNRRDEAIESLETFLERNPQKSAQFSSWLGILRDETGRWSAGEPWHRKAVD